MFRNAKGGVGNNQAPKVLVQIDIEFIFDSHCKKRRHLYAMFLFQHFDGIRFRNPTVFRFLYS
jgi:hypothetical protein